MTRKNELQRQSSRAIVIRINCSEKYCDDCCFKRLTEKGSKITRNNEIKADPYDVFRCDLYDHILFHEVEGKTYRLGCCILAGIENKS
jgi:hypothetical protein